MRAKVVFADVIKSLGISQAEAARRAGMDINSLAQKINVRESIRADEFFELLESLGVDVTFTVKGTNTVLDHKKTGHGRRVRGMSDGEKYDTKYSEALSNSFYVDGIHEYGEDGLAEELYVDQEGRYFFAEYNRDEPSRDRVRAVRSNIAVAFMEKYGSEIEKRKE